MFEFPKLVSLLLLFGAVWIAYRWINAPARQLPRRRARATRPALPAEDLTACRICGAYVAARSPACGRFDCPQRR
jgi:hypothetical protein